MTVDIELLEKHFTPYDLLGDGGITYLRGYISLFKSFNNPNQWYFGLNQNVYLTNDEVNGLLHFYDIL